VVPKEEQSCSKKYYDEFLNTVVLSLIFLFLSLLLSIRYNVLSTRKAPAASASVVEATRSTGVVAIGFSVLDSNRCESKATLYINLASTDLLNE